MPLTPEQITALAAQMPWWLCVGFAILGIILLLFCLWINQPGLCVKLTGSSLVLSLAFAANQTVIYGIAMFIVATLVTELEFLERIAAIFWRSEPYFKWRMGTASQSDVQEKLTQEIASDKDRVLLNFPIQNVFPKAVDEGTTEKVKAALTQAREFENAIAAAIAAGKPPFTARGTLYREKLIKSRRFKGVIDFIFETPVAHYLIEAKRNIDLQSVAIDQVTRYAHYYSAYLSERGISGPVYPIVIVPADARIEGKLPTNVYILRFDGENFVNASEVPIFG